MSQEPEKSGEVAVKTSGDLVHWLKMLALPTWVKVALGLIIILILGCALALMLIGLFAGNFAPTLKIDHESISVASAILTISLPVGLVVLALIFGDSGAKKLAALTDSVLKKQIPTAISGNLTGYSRESRYQNVEIECNIRGCIADYRLTVIDNHANDAAIQRKRHLNFKLELNVKKVNFVVWLPKVSSKANTLAELLTQYKSCFFGAEKEGYVRNGEPLLGEKLDHVGIVFIKTLGTDFLLNPAERLYFAQDFAFFIRGLLDAEAPHEH